ncbi:hypothetical protein [Rickettsia endosymbiont of Orchestes rusci]
MPCGNDILLLLSSHATTAPHNDGLYGPLSIKLALMREGGNLY